jgi:hypothetical protein
VIVASSILTVNLKSLGLEDRQEELQGRATFNGKLIALGASTLF